MYLRCSSSAWSCCRQLGVDDSIHASLADLVFITFRVLGGPRLSANQVGHRSSESPGFPYKSRHTAIFNITSVIMELTEQPGVSTPRKESFRYHPCLEMDTEYSDFVEPLAKCVKRMIREERWANEQKKYTPKEDFNRNTFLKTPIEVPVLKYKPNPSLQATIDKLKLMLRKS